MGAGLAHNIAAAGLTLRLANLAEDGALVVLASGPEEAKSVVTPALEAIGSRPMWVADSLALTRDLGLDPALFLEAVAGGAMDAPYVQLKGKAMLAGDAGHPQAPRSRSLQPGDRDPETGSRTRSRDRPTRRSGSRQDPHRALRRRRGGARGASHGPWRLRS